MPEDWRPLTDVTTAGRRAALLARVRDYFARADVLAVDTPLLGRFTSSDPGIESLQVMTSDGRCAYLQTSPEFFLKRMLAAGYPDIYSIGPAFRDGESGRGHAAEFTLIEWYRLNFGLEAIIADTIGLIADCLERPELNDSPVTVDYADAFRDAANVDVFGDDLETLAERADADTALREQLGGDHRAWLDLILTSSVAPAFAKDRLTVLRHYPAEQAALARICPADDRVADRFEVFFGDLELANGYVELTDVDVQRQRFDNERKIRAHRNQAVHAPDPQFLAALAHGLPDCAGVALGFERLHMLYDRRQHIRDVQSFATEAHNV